MKKEKVKIRKQEKSSWEPVKVERGKYLKKVSNVNA